MPTLSEQHIVHDFKLPNYSNELSKAEDLISKFKYKIQELIVNENITDTIHDHFYNEIIRVLDYVGRLSTPAFDIQDELERMYTLKFKHSPELAKRLWLEHYETIHHPYNLLKNRCFRMLDDLDKCYENIHGVKPPNWKI
jgi:hypothetical protein